MALIIVMLINVERSTILINTFSVSGKNSELLKLRIAMISTFKVAMLNGCISIFQYININFAILNKVKAARDAMAAPIIPHFGINNKLVKIVNTANKGMA